MEKKALIDSLIGCANGDECSCSKCVIGFRVGCADALMRAAAKMLNDYDLVVPKKCVIHTKDARAKTDEVNGGF